VSSKPYMRAAWTLVFLIFSSNAAVAESDKQKVSSSTTKGTGYLVFGFLPMESPVSLFKRFAPLRDYLSEQIEQEIRLETAKDFPSFAQRTTERKYDIVFTAPHMALHALDSDKYEAAATFIKPLESVLVVKRGSSVQNLKQLEGKTIATPPEQAIVTMVGKNFLSNQGVNTTRYTTYQTHNAAYAAVLGGEADAAIVSNFIAMKAIAANQPLEVIASSRPFPGIGILVAKDLPDQTKSHIKKAFWGMKELPHGKNILNLIAQPGYMEASKAPFEVLRPFINAALN